MKTTILAITTLVSILTPLSANAQLQDRMTFETRVDFYEYICQLYKSRQSNRNIIQLGQEYYLNNGNFQTIGNVSDREFARIQMQRKMLALNNTNVALEVVMEDRRCQ